MSPIRFRKDDDHNADEKAATEADALEIWTVKDVSTGEKALSIELCFDGKNFSFRHTFTNQKDVEDVIDALRSCMRDCWPSPLKAVN